MIRTLIFSSLLFGACCNSFAQSIPKSKYILESVGISIGDNNNYSNTLSARSWQRLAPSEISIPDSALSSSSSYSPYSSTLIGFRAVIAPTGKNTKKFRTTYRIGLALCGSTPLEGEFYTNSDERIDTLTSSQTGRTYFVDSSSTHNYKYRYQSQLTLIDLGIQLNTNHDKRWSAFGGISASLGVSQGTTVFEHSSYSFLKQYSNPFTYSHIQSSFGGSPGTEEKFTGGNGYAFAISIPFGVQFKVSNTHPAFSKIRLTAEFRPGVMIESIPDFETVSYSFVNRTFGILVDI